MRYDQVTLDSWYEETSQGSHGYTSALDPNGHGIDIGKPEKGSYYLNGRIAEIVLYYEALNADQRIIASNYMAAKYAIALAKYAIALAANDFYDEDDAGNGDYDFDVAGIGQAVDGSNHTNARGTGIWRVSGATELGDGEYLFWGRDNGSEGATATGVPATVEEMLARGWRMSETGDVGDVTISVHLTSPVTASDLRLIIDDDDDGDFSDETPESGLIGGATSIGDNEYQFAGVANIGDNKRCTLGTIDKTHASAQLKSHLTTPCKAFRRRCRGLHGIRTMLATSMNNAIRGSCSDMNTFAGGSAAPTAEVEQWPTP